MSHCSSLEVMSEWINMAEASLVRSLLIEPILRWWNIWCCSHSWFVSSYSALNQTRIVWYKTWIYRGSQITRYTSEMVVYIVIYRTQLKWHGKHCANITIYDTYIHTPFRTCSAHTSDHIKWALCCVYFASCTWSHIKSSTPITSLPGSMSDQLVEYGNVSTLQGAM